MQASPSCLHDVWRVILGRESPLCETPPPTLYADVAVDIYFVLDIFLTFFMGVFVNGVYVDAPAQVGAKKEGGESARDERASKSFEAREQRASSFKTLA